jgi:hypothetical protein
MSTGMWALVGCFTMGLALLIVVPVLLEPGPVPVASFAFVAGLPVGISALAWWKVFSRRRAKRAAAFVQIS